MAVNEYGGEVGIDDLLAVYDGVTFCGNDLGHICTGIKQALLNGFGAFDHISFVFTSRAHGRDPEQGKKFIEKPFFILFLVIFPDLHS